MDIRKAPHSVKRKGVLFRLAIRRKRFRTLVERCRRPSAQLVLLTPFNASLDRYEPVSDEFEVFSSLTEGGF